MIIDLLFLQIIKLIIQRGALCIQKWRHSKEERCEQETKQNKNILTPHRETVLSVSRAGGFRHRVFITLPHVTPIVSHLAFIQTPFLTFFVDKSRKKTQVKRNKPPKTVAFSFAYYATLHPDMSVGWSVGWLVGPFFGQRL